MTDISSPSPPVIGKKFVTEVVASLEDVLPKWFDYTIDPTTEWDSDIQTIDDVYGSFYRCGVNFTIYCYPFAVQFLVKVCKVLSGGNVLYDLETYSPTTQGVLTAVPMRMCIEDAAMIVEKLNSRRSDYE